METKELIRVDNKVMEIMEVMETMGPTKEGIKPVKLMEVTETIH